MIRAVKSIVLFSTLSVSIAVAQQKEVKLFAHRGGKLEYDENTLSAFQESYKRGIRGFELDIRLTKDKQLVILHDGSLKRTVGPDKPIEDLTLKEVKSLKTLKGNRIPTLDEMLAFFRDKPGLYVEFEMKTQSPEYDEKTVSQYCDEVYRKIHEVIPANSEYVLTSFDKRPLAYLKAKYPSAELVLLKSEGLSKALIEEAKSLKVNRIGCRVERTTRDMILEAKKQNIKVSLWPGHSVDDFLLGVMLGSDRLCTDVPVEVMQWVKANAPWIKII